MIACLVIFASRALELSASLVSPDLYRPFGPTVMGHAASIHFSEKCSLVLMKTGDMGGVIGWVEPFGCHTTLIAGFVSPCGGAVAAVWAVLALSGRWRSEASWVVRLGRVLAARYSWARSRAVFTGWLKPPRVITRPFHKNGRGLGRKIPRLASGSPPPRRVEELLDQRRFADQPWQRWRVKDGEKGPMIWEVKHALFTPKDEEGMPGDPMHLVAARNVLDPKEVKFFVSNAPPETAVAKLLLVAFSRWRVERCFEDQKSEIGLDQYEGRRYQGLKRHLILSCVSYLFLSRMRKEFGGEKAGADGVPGPHGGGGFDPILVAEAEAAERVAGTDLIGDRAGTTPGGCGAEGSHQADPPQAPRDRNQAHRAAPVQLGLNLAQSYLRLGQNSQDIPSCHAFPRGLSAVLSREPAIAVSLTSHLKIAVKPTT